MHVTPEKRTDWMYNRLFFPFGLLARSFSQLINRLADNFADLLGGFTGGSADNLVSLGLFLASEIDRERVEIGKLH